MFKTKSSLPLFLLACCAHAISFFYMFAHAISSALDGSRQKSVLDWVPLFIFLATFTLHSIPVLRDSWKSAPIKYFILLAAVSFLLVYMFALAGIQF